MSVSQVGVRAPLRRVSQSAHVQTGLRIHWKKIQNEELDFFYFFIYETVGNVGPACLTLTIVVRIILHLQDTMREKFMRHCVVLKFAGKKAA